MHSHMAKLKNKQSTIWPGMRGRVDIPQVYRESHLAIGWTELKCKDMDELAKEGHTYHLSLQRN